MAKLCTIIYQPSEVIEGSTFDKLIKRWPKAAFHDLKNRLFNSVDKDAIDPLIVETLLPNFVQEVNEEGEPIGPSYIDSLVAILAPYLYGEDRSRPIHVLKSVLSQLYRHPAYQAFIEEMNPTQEEELTNINKEP